LNDLAGIEDLNTYPDINLYPNPCTDHITVDAETVQAVHIFDFTGKVVLTSANKQINVSSLSKGVYSILIITKEYRVVKKLIKL
jgi:hypothetical protein